MDVTFLRSYQTKGGAVGDDVSEDKGEGMGGEGDSIRRERVHTAK